MKLTLEIPNVLICQVLSIMVLTTLPIMAVHAEISPETIANFNAMMSALVKNLPNVVRLIVAVAYVMGIWMILSSLYTLKIYGDLRTMMPSNVSFGAPLFRIILGVFLLLMPRLVIISIYSLWGRDSTILTYYQLSPGMAQWQPAVNGVIAVIRVFGYISFVRGFMLLAKATRHGSQPGLYGKGLMHVVGGILAINIVGTITIIQHSFGFV